MVTEVDIKARLEYNQTTGIFTWLNGVNSGKQAGSLDAKGYRIIKLKGKAYKAHRLAVLYMTGKFPTLSVDHIDRVHDNNAWYNLREATDSEQMLNRSTFKNNTSGTVGVSWDKSTNKWKAQLNINKVNYYCGLFINKQDAIDAVTNMREEILIDGDRGRYKG